MDPLHSALLIRVFGRLPFGSVLSSDGALERIPGHMDGLDPSQGLTQSPKP